MAETVAAAVDDGGDRAVGRALEHDIRSGRGDEYVSRAVQTNPPWVVQAVSQAVARDVDDLSHGRRCQKPTRCDQQTQAR